VHTLLSCLFFPILGSSFLLRSIDKHAENKEEVIATVLDIQKSLLLPLDVMEMPDFAKTGFITIQMDPQYLDNFLQEGEIIVAYHEKQIIAYLLLDAIDSYITWAEQQSVDLKEDLISLSGSKYIDQIGVLSAYARNGIGTALIDYAKSRSSKGLLADILLEPYPNRASSAFFDHCGFVCLGTVQVNANHLRPAHNTSVFYWSPVSSTP
jgi:GNAT superfamily N-acetyltransferase